MKKVKITVLKTTLDEELAAEYGAEGLGPCPMLREGQVFYADYAKPDGLCDEAWKAIYQYVFALAHGVAHGLELPALSSPWLYALGFVAATAALHAAGYALVRFLPQAAAPLVRLAGLASAGAGVWLLAG